MAPGAPASTTPPASEDTQAFPFHRDSGFSKAFVAVFLIVPPLATAYAVVAMFTGRGPSGTDLILLASLWAFAGLGVSVGFHRMLTHRALHVRAPARFVLLVAGTMSLQGAAADWATTHARHHARADRDGDPHSPEGGFWHAHCLWLLRDRCVRSGPFHDRLMADPVTRFVTRTWLVWAGLGLAIPAAVGFAATGTWLGAWTGFLWGGLVRVFVGHHVTWSVNSLGHRFGTKPFRTTDASTNNWLIALLGWGEGWHNNHHAFPNAARLGMRWWHIGMGAWLIAVLKVLGQVPRIVMPTRDERRARRRTRADDPPNVA